MPALTLNRSEVVALALMQGLMAQSSAALPFVSALHGALDKATAGLSPALLSLKEAAGSVLREVHGAARDYSHAPLETLLLAAQRKQTVEMLYDSRNSGTCEHRRADPYRLDRREGRYLEMQAWCHKRQSVCTFALNRVLEAHLLDETFTLREWNDSDEGVVSGLRGGPWVEVEVRFDSVAAPYAKDQGWPFETAFEAGEDGSVVMRGRTQGMDGIVCELLRWRRHVTVLGSPELRNRMIEEVRAITALYSTAEQISE